MKIVKMLWREGDKVSIKERIFYSRSMEGNFTIKSNINDKIILKEIGIVYNPHTFIPGEKEFTKEQLNFVADRPNNWKSDIYQ